MRPGWPRAIRATQGKSEILFHGPKYKKVAIFLKKKSENQNPFEILQQIKDCGLSLPLFLPQKNKPL
jgi:hypothetical protein